MAPSRNRTLSKAAIVGILFAILMFALIIFETLSPQVECEVCMELDGRRKCLTVKGQSEDQAIQTAKENACSFITTGRAEGFRCSAAPPASVRCKPL